MYITRQVHISFNVFMQHVFRYLKTTFPNIEQIKVFSDSPTSQFKQRFLFSNLYAWEMEHDLKITWNFFATSHGKGVVDGIGGTVKRAVWRHVKAERAQVTNASEYSTLGKRLCPNIHIKVHLKRRNRIADEFLGHQME